MATDTPIDQLQDSRRSRYAMSTVNSYLDAEQANF